MSGSVVLLVVVVVVLVGLGWRLLAQMLAGLVALVFLVGLMTLLDVVSSLA